MQKVDVCVCGTIETHISCSECGQDLEIVHSADDFGTVYFEVKPHTCASKENKAIKAEGNLMIEKPFLEARLRVAQKEWKKAEKKWHKLCDSKNKDDSWAVRAAETRMAFLNGQRQLLKEFIGLETATNDNNDIKGEGK